MKNVKMIEIPNPASNLAFHFLVVAYTVSQHQSQIKYLLINFDKLLGLILTISINDLLISIEIPFPSRLGIHPSADSSANPNV